MREIKFRAWDKANKKMRRVETMTINSEGDVISIEVWGDRIQHSEVSGSQELIMLLGVEFRLMQYTGLSDKNGKEIYEGDVLEYYDGENNNIGPVTWQEDSASFGCNNRTYLPEKYLPGPLFREVIGDIYSNPELIKQQ